MMLDGERVDDKKVKTLKEAIQEHIEVQMANNHEIEETVIEQRKMNGKKKSQVNPQ